MAAVSNFAPTPSAITQAFAEAQDRPQTYTSQQSYTPPDSDPSTPKDVSPASPRSVWGLSTHLQLQTKQLRSPRSPMYVPAVLRPTEKPVRQSPPKSGHIMSGAANTRPGSADTQPSAAQPRPGLSRMVTEEWNEDMVTAVTGPPSRNHWKPDLSSVVCDYSVCDKTFTIFKRRHHCRRCGNIFCAEHSLHIVPLDQHARFHPMAPRFRACEDCFRDYRVWETERVKRGNSSSGESTDSAPGPRGSVEIHGKKKADGGLMNTLAQSVPRDWNWSTF